MPLASGTRLGPYEIVAPLGAGGMGEVYRARDATLNRDVALKILPDAFATDPDRLARFRREAQVLASLNHTNIGHIYGFEDALTVLSKGSGQASAEQAGIRHTLVLELVEGPTLADRIAQGPLALSDALPIAKQIAEALEAAHEQGIVHRDLKPANIKVKDDGTVKVLDFGLARALDPTGAATANSPTMTNRATEAGVILGTAAYMAPEQAKGKAVDKRADIWSFGVVVCEMLTGRRLFRGEDVSDTLAEVLKTDPDWSALPAATPAAIRQLLRRCLERDPKQRLRDIGEARIAIERASSGAPEVSPPVRGRGLPWILAGVFGLVAVAVVLLLWRAKTSKTMDQPLRRLAVAPPGDPGNILVSPDGQWLLAAAGFSETGGGGGRGTAPAMVRRIDSSEWRSLPGTAGSDGFFWSADSRQIGFGDRDAIKKVDVLGSNPRIICSNNGPGQQPRGRIVLHG